MTTPPNAPRPHARESFYKYTPASTALLILSNRTLRWSSPLLFNDPFDVPRELAVGMTAADIDRAVRQRLAEILRDPSADLAGLNPSISEVLSRLRQRNSQRLHQAIQEMLSNPSPPDAQEKQAASLEEFRKVWRGLLPTFRILCLSETSHSISMWYHYADKYKGVVIELRCTEELDSPWLMARPVQYPPEAPEILLPAGMGRLVTMHPEGAMRYLLDEYTYFKSSDWAYEKEWRVASFSRPGEGDRYTDYPIDPRNFTSVYLGPHISSGDADAIRSLLVGPLAHVRLYQARIELDRRFSFTQIARP